MYFLASEKLNFYPKLMYHCIYRIPLKDRFNRNKNDIQKYNTMFPI